VGIIGGSGLSNPDILKDKTDKVAATPYGMVCNACDYTYQNKQHMYLEKCQLSRFKLFFYTISQLHGPLQIIKCAFIYGSVKSWQVTVVNCNINCVYKYISIK
jgi:hypothetical protein